MSHHHPHCRPTFSQRAPLGLSPPRPQVMTKVDGNYSIVTSDDVVVVIPKRCGEPDPDAVVRLCLPRCPNDGEVHEIDAASNAAQLDGGSFPITGGGFVPKGTGLVVRFTDLTFSVGEPCSDDCECGCRKPKGVWIPIGIVTEDESCALCVPDLEALTAFSTAGVEDCCCVRVAVATLGCAVFLLDPASVQVPDGITIVETDTGDGRWIRTAYDTPTWKYQTEWFIDPPNGNDENDGATAATALRSHAELERRLGPHPLLSGADSTDNPGFGINRFIIHLLNDGDPNDPIGTFFWQVPDIIDRPFGLVAYLGEKPEADRILASGTFGPGTLSFGRDANQAQVVDIGVAAAAMIGARIRITSGAFEGYYAWIAKDLNLGIARTSVFATTDGFGLGVIDALAFDFGLLQGAPAVGDSFVVESLTKWSVRESSFDDKSFSDGVAGFANLELEGYAFGIVSLANGPFSNYAGCSFSSQTTREWAEFTPFIRNCGARFGVRGINNLTVVQGGLVLGGAAVQFGAHMEIDYDTLVQGQPFGFNGLQSNDNGSEIIAHACAVFDSTVTFANPTGAGVTLGAKGAGASLRVTPGDLGVSLLWGDGNVGPGILSLAGCSISWDIVDLPDGVAVRGITGTGGDFRLGEPTAQMRAFDETAGIYTALSPSTWANLSAPPFSGDGQSCGHNVSLDSHIFALPT